MFDLKRHYNTDQLSFYTKCYFIFTGVHAVDKPINQVTYDVKIHVINSIISEFIAILAKIERVGERERERERERGVVPEACYIFIRERLERAHLVHTSSPDREARVNITN